MFAIVIAESFPISIKIFVPFTNLLTYNGIENALTLILIYFFIITSWIGYFSSITLNPHTQTKTGISRFSIDLFIIFLYYYLILLAQDISHHGDIFVYVLPLIFSAFLVWDFLRYVEYKNVKRESKQAHANRKNRLGRTGLVLVLFIILSLSYAYLIPLKKLTIDGNVVVWNILFIAVSFTIVFVYRWKTLEHPKGRQSTKSLS